MAKNQSRKGITQKAKEGLIFTKTIKIGSDKIALQWRVEKEIVKPTKPIDPKPTDIKVVK
jgi:hypothetical protein